MLIERGFEMSWDDFTVVEKLQCEFSDFHKDFYGFRPRWVSNEQWNDQEFLEGQIQRIHDEMDQLKRTFQGREHLREQGWVIEETDPELAQRAKWLDDERKREQEAWYAEMEKQCA